MMNLQFRMNESFADCAVCFDAFENSDTKKPTVGVCGHSICITCGKELRSKNQSKCPLCNHENSFQKETINYQLMEILDKFDAISAKKNASESTGIKSRTRTELFDIALPKGASLGIGLSGGSEKNTTITVSRVYKGYCGDLSGKLFVGDEILGVSGKNLMNSTRKEAIQILMAEKDVLHLEVRYKLNSQGQRVKVVELTEWNNKLVQQLKTIGLKLIYEQNTDGPGSGSPSTEKCTSCSKQVPASTVSYCTKCALAENVISSEEPHLMLFKNPILLPGQATKQAVHYQLQRRMVCQNCAATHSHKCVRVETLKIRASKQILDDKYNKTLKADKLLIDKVAGILNKVQTNTTQNVEVMKNCVLNSASKEQSDKMEKFLDQYKRKCAIDTKLLNHVVQQYVNNSESLSRWSEAFRKLTEGNHGKDSAEWKKMKKQMEKALARQESSEKKNDPCNIS